MDTERLLTDKTNLAAPPYQYGANQQYGTNQPSMSIPNEDLHENANQTQPVATAPPVTHMDRVSGYDNMQFDNCKGTQAINDLLVDQLQDDLFGFCRCISTASSL